MSYASDRYQDIKNNLDRDCCKQVSDSVIDGGKEALGGWEAGRALLLALIEDRGRLEYASRPVGTIQAPTVDVYLDAPAAAAANMTMKDGICGVKDGDSWAFGYTRCAECASSACGNLLTASKGSLVDSIYEAGTIVVPVIEALLNAGIKKDDILWAFSSCPLPVLAASDEQADLHKKEALAESTVSVWVRSIPDSVRSLPAFAECGDIRIHDYENAATLLKGNIR